MRGGICGKTTEMSNVELHGIRFSLAHRMQPDSLAVRSRAFRGRGVQPGRCRTCSAPDGSKGQGEGKSTLAADGIPQILRSLSPRPDKVAMKNAAFDHFASLSNSATSTATS